MSYVIGQTLAREKLAPKLLYTYSLGSTNQTSGNFALVKLNYNWLSVIGIRIAILWKVYTLDQGCS